MDFLNQCIAAIADPSDAQLERQIQLRLDSLTKPAGSLGMLESLAAQYCLLHGQARPRLEQIELFLFCADHGVVAEGVSAYPSEVTAQMVANFVSGGAAVCVLARQQGVKTIVVNAGVRSPVVAHIDLGFGPGTANFTRKPAMSRHQAERALEAGARLAINAPATIDCFAVGEMGIGNTTSAAALTCVFTVADPCEVTGTGTGIDPAGLDRKLQAIASALALHTPHPDDPIGALATVGGLEIATMAGFLIGAASRRVPILLDGFITGAAALAAVQLAPAARPYLLCSHRSAEPGHRRILSHLEMTPLLDLGLRLGEGTGALLALGLLRSACKLYDEMATFDSAGVSRS